MNFMITSTDTNICILNQNLQFFGRTLLEMLTLTLDVHRGAVLPGHFVANLGGPRHHHLQLVQDPHCRRH
jgi:hypothetical protein